MDRCLIHFEGEDGCLTPFTEKSLQTFIESRQQWLLLDGEQNKVAIKTLTFIDEGITEPRSISETYYYHRNCYSKFTNKTFIKRAEARRKGKRSIEQQGNQSSTAKNNQSSTAGAADSDGQTKTKLLRSSRNSCSFANPKKKHVLAPYCIICKQEKSYYTDPVCL